MIFKISNETPASKLGYGTIQLSFRGEIKSTTNWRQAGTSNVGRKPTNAEYSTQNGMTKRMASKKRLGY
jgi:hypothetical protein